MFYTIKEIAEELKLSISKVYALIARGDLPCYEFGAAKRVSEADFRTFLEQHRKEAVKLPPSSKRHF